MKNFDLQAHLKSGETKQFQGFSFRSPARPITCVDGFRFSIQASRTHYCEPRDDDGPYTHVEVGFPSERVELLMEFAEDAEKPTETVYGYVPIDFITAIIELHGGVKE